MTDISLLSIVRGRRPQLENLIRGVAAQSSKPTELVLVFMNEDPATDLPDLGCPIYSHRITSTVDDLPLAAARNRAAAEANGSILGFLDVDCIPHPDYVSKLEEAVCLTKGLIMGDIRYLPEGAAHGQWTMEQLEKAAVPHPRRPLLLPDKQLIDLDYALFWSLTFGIRKEDFARVGGFDEAYRGYGGEDTDFAFSADKVHLPFFGCAARVYHQYHDTYTPPYNHLGDLIVNANRFYDKWRIWPMTGWLQKFAAEGYIDWGDSEITLIREPDAAAIAGAKSQYPIG